MKNCKLVNVYRCTLVSDRDVRHINVATSSFGKAADLCYRAISLWENKESYELTKLQLMEDCFINRTL